MERRLPIATLTEKPVKAYLAGKRRIGAKPLEDEIVKTSEERKIVGLVGRFISDELSDLGVTGNVLSENQVYPSSSSLQLHDLTLGSKV